MGIPGLDIAAEEHKKQIQLLLTSPDLLPKVWPHVLPLLEEGSEAWEEYFTLESLYANIASGRFQLWTLNDADEFFAMMLTETIMFPKTSVLNMVLACGSDVEVWFDFLDCFEHMAASWGISKVKIYGRKGWKKILESQGFREERTSLVKDIKPTGVH